MKKRDLDAFRELYSSVYENQINEVSFSDLIPRVPGVGMKPGEAERIYRQARAERATNQRAQLGVVKTNRGYVAKPGATSYDPQKSAEAIRLANRLNKETGLGTPKPPKTKPKLGDNVTPVSTPKPEAGAKVAPTAVTKPAASSTVLAKKGGVEGKLDKSTGKFTAGAFSSTEKSRYASVAAQNAARNAVPKPPAQTSSPAVGKLGSTSFERRTPTSAELRAAQAERATQKASGQDTSSVKNAEKALQAAQKTNLPTTGPSPAIPDLKSVNADLAKANSPSVINKPAPAGSALAKQQAQQKSKLPTPMTQTQSFEWGSTSKIVDDIADAYASIYEGKKKDQDGDNDEDFADVMIARMIASGMSRAEAIAAVKNKEYNEEYGIKVPAKATDAQALKGLIPKGSKVHEMKKKTPTLQNASYEPEADMVDEATRMRKELGKEGEIETRKELAARSKAYKRSGSVDKTIAAAERGADRPYVKHKRGESDSDRTKREDAQSRTLRRLAASRRGSVRGNESLRGYASKVEGDDKELQSARSSARSAGTLTPAEKKKLGEEFYMWVEALIDEGYDLSEYTWDEMYDIYEETDKEREERLAARRARVREMESQGRVMTSSKRTSERAKQRREEQKAERLERLANQALADTRGVSRRSSKPMGSEEPASKPAAPEANRKLKGVVKRDTLASRADELLRMIQSEDFELWLEDLIEEGYELSEWTDDEIIDLYEEIIEEKYGTAAGRKRVAKMARSGKDIGKKGPGFQKMVDKLTPKYGKERATKIAAAQMYKTHA